MFNQLDRRLNHVEASLDYQDVGEVFCECSNMWDARALIFGKDCPEQPPCASEVHNPRPVSLLRPDGNPDAIYKKLLGDDWEEIIDSRPVNVGMEFSEELETTQLDLLPEPEPALKKTGDELTDKIAARLLKPKLSKEQLAEKLLVPTDQTQGDNHPD